MFVLEVISVLQDDVASVVAERLRDEKILKADPHKFKAEIAKTVLRRKVASVLMNRLGYSQEELDCIGDDVDLMQGTGMCILCARVSWSYTYLSTIAQLAGNRMTIFITGHTNHT